MTINNPNPPAEVPSGQPAGATPAGGDSLGDGGRKALDEERKARRDAERQAKDLQARVAELEAAAVRRDVAAAHGLSEAQAKRLVGSTRDELEADAAELLELLAPPPSRQPIEAKPREQLHGGGDPTSAVEATPGAIADRIIGRGL